jgi:dihydroorotase-like cyclic amidohydrolase
VRILRRIAEVGEDYVERDELGRRGLAPFPGFVDVHAHWRTLAERTRRP